MRARREHRCRATSVWCFCSTASPEARPAASFHMISCCKLGTQDFQIAVPMLFCSGRRCHFLRLFSKRMFFIFLCTYYVLIQGVSPEKWHHSQTKLIDADYTAYIILFHSCSVRILIRFDTCMYLSRYCKIPAYSLVSRTFLQEVRRFFHVRSFFINLLME